MFDHPWLNLLLPSRCPLCGVRVTDKYSLCESCWQCLPLQPLQLCHRCGEEVTMALPNGCGFCRERLLIQDRTICAFPYEPPVSSLLLGAKFADKNRWAAIIASWGWLRCHEQLRELNIEGVVPIPLHAKRLRQRRFNQSALLAGQLAKRLEKPLWTDNLTRHRMTRPQTRLDRKQRQANVMNSFLAQFDASPPQHLLLVDDTMTTGATVSEAAKALKQAGVQEVTVMVMAKAMNHGMALHQRTPFTIP
ncbi:ComF family protein [Magnetococcus sp. PR-3]|uniref:ComF family protein n=1 Tax=Magnetococcus sp. PR-3 TaxID=3120355 RepID=UPI002FCE4B25